MKQVAAIYGARHPHYQLVQTKLQRLEAELNALSEESKDRARVVAGDSFIPGDVVVGPNVKRATIRAVYTEVNARLQTIALGLGGPVNYVSPGEGALRSRLRCPTPRR